MIEIQKDRENARTLERLDKLSVELKSKAVGSGLTSAAKPIKALMKSLAPEDTGKLKQAVNQTRISARASRRLELFGETQTLAPGEVAILIGPNKKVGGRSRAGIASLLEFGTAPHDITPKNRRGLKGILRIGKSGFARKVRHPGIKPRRFMQKSLDMNEAQIEQLFLDGVAKRIDKLM